MGVLGEGTSAIESLIFIVVLLALIKFFVDGLEAIPAVDFESGADDAIEDAYDHVSGLWGNE